MERLIMERRKKRNTNMEIVQIINQQEKGKMPIFSLSLSPHG